MILGADQRIVTMDRLNDRIHLTIRDLGNRVIREFTHENGMITWDKDWIFAATKLLASEVLTSFCKRDQISDLEAVGVVIDLLHDFEVSRLSDRCYMAQYGQADCPRRFVATSAEVGCQDLWASADSSGTTKHYHRDHLGTPRLITDAAGNRLSYEAYTPYGLPLVGNGEEKLQFTGHERDAGNLD